MKFADVVLIGLFILGCFVGTVMAKTYLIPRFFPSIALPVAVAQTQEAA